VRCSTFQFVAINLFSAAIRVGGKVLPEKYIAINIFTALITLDAGEVFLLFSSFHA